MQKNIVLKFDEFTKSCYNIIVIKIWAIVNFLSFLTIAQALQRDTKVSASPWRCWIGEAIRVTKLTTRRTNVLDKDMW